MINNNKSNKNNNKSNKNNNKSNKNNNNNSKKKNNSSKKKSMYSSSDDSDRYSDRYSDSDRERTGDDGSIPVANKEESTLLNYEHEYDVGFQLHGWEPPVPRWAETDQPLWNIIP